MLLPPRIATYVDHVPRQLPLGWTQRARREAGGGGCEEAAPEVEAEVGKAAGKGGAGEGDGSKVPGRWVRMNGEGCGALQRGDTMQCNGFKFGDTANSGLALKIDMHKK